MERFLIISHVIAGGLTLVTGLLAAFVGKKGGKLHKQVGTTFFWSMFWIFVSTVLIISFVRFSCFLFVSAVFSFYMSFSGVRVLKIKKTNTVEKVDWIAAIITMIFGVAMVALGLYYLLETENMTMGFLCFFFGFFTTNTARINYVGFKKIAQADKMWWWFAHMNLMVGSLIASITAFLVLNGRIFDLPSEMAWIPWVLSALIGSPFTSYWANKYRKQFKVGKYATT